MATTTASRDSPSQTARFVPSTAAPTIPSSLSSDPQSLTTSSKNPLLRRSKSPQAQGGSITGLNIIQSPTSSKSQTLAGLAAPPLTGAVAMADERRMREEKAREASGHTSPNPSAKVLESLMGTAGTGMSRVQDAPPEVTNMSEGLMKVANKVKIPEASGGDLTQRSPISMSSIGSLDATSGLPSITAHVNDGSLASDVHTPRGEGTVNGRVPNDAYVAASNAVESSHRANTYPGPAPLDPASSSGQRSNSMSMAGGHGQNSPRSPSTRRHKCPYCTQDFTRHHNLKSHLLTHSQEKPYVCQTCQARFRRLHDLKRHTKLHTGERPHTCNKCGRRFARGDALARHNKGQGGCAGRRSSFEADDEFGPGDDSMDGVVYPDDPGDDQMDEDEPSPGGSRRVSEPSGKSRSRQDSGTTGPYSHHSSTYPPPAPRMIGSSSRGLQPPNPYPGSSTAASSRDPGSASSNPYVPGPPAAYAQGLMTESPKPLSPGQSHAEGSRLSVSGPGSLHRTRSPSLTQHLHHQQYARASGGGATPPMGMGLPPPPPPTATGSSHPQLPQLPGLNPATDPRLGSSYPPPHAGNGGSNAGSLSSHGHSSGGSMREILHGGAAAAPAQNSSEGDLWKYIRDLEGRFNRMQEEYEVRIRNLQEEIHGLRR